jgi:hypothetical protein
MLMFGLSDEDILAFFGLATVLATFSKIWAIFCQTFGHPGRGTLNGIILTVLINKLGHSYLQNNSVELFCMVPRQ